MANSKIESWQLWTSLQAEEQVYFKEWLRLEIELYKAPSKILDLLNAWEDHKDEERLWDDLPDIQGWARRNLRSQLATKIKLFLSLENLRKNTQDQQLHLLQELNQRNASDIFEKIYKKAITEVNKHPSRDTEYYRLLYNLEVEFQIFHHRHYSKVGQKSLQKAVNYLDISICLEKLHTLFGIMFYEGKFDKGFQYALREELISFLDQWPLVQQYPVLKFYRDLFHLIKDQNQDPKDLFFQLKELGDQISQENQLSCFTTLINFLAARANRLGGVEELQTMLEAFQWAISKGFLIQANTISSAYYKNLVYCALRTGQHALAYTYIHDFKDFLPNEGREELFQLCLGSYHFEIQDYKQVENAFQQIRFANPHYDLSAQIISLQTDYELDKDPVWIEGRVENLISRIRKSPRISNRDREPFLNRCKLFRRLLTADRPAKLEKLLHDLLHTQPINNQQWLIQKVQAQLSKKNL